MIPPPPYRRQSSANSPLRTSPFSDRRKPFLIGVAGGTASGKSSVCDKIIQAVIRQNIGTTDKQIIAISQDSFYRNLEPKESVEAVKGNFNFDHPDAFDHKMLISCLEDIMESRPTRIPVYDFKTNSRVPDKWTAVNPSDVVIVEGILIFYHKEVRDLFDMKLFVDTDADTRLARRVLRDLEERNRSLEHILNQYTRLVKPAFEEFCFPTKKYADVIIPRGADNTVAVDLVAQHIQDIICSRNSSSKSDSPFSRSRSNSDSFVRQF